MTERRDGGIEERLGQWFDREVEQARVDLRREPMVPVSAPPRRPSRFGLAVAVVALAVVAIGLPLATGRWTETDTAPLPSTPASPRPSAEPPTFVDVDITGWYADGVPASIDGRPVDRPGLSGLDAGLSDLKGGWVVDGPGWACERPEDEPCLRAWLANAPSGDGQLMIPGVEEIPPAGWIAVYRLAADVQDPEGTTTGTLVWAADPATFIADRFGDGIPRHVGGEEVIPVADLVETLAGVPDDRSVLVGGWALQTVTHCPATLSEPVTKLLIRCSPMLLTSEPQGTGTRGIPLVPKEGIPSVPIITEGLEFPDGMVVLRVHGHDPRAAACVEWARDDCEAAIVVDEVAWAGDEWTETVPLTTTDVIDRLRDGAMPLELAAMPREGRVQGCTPDTPPMSWFSREGGQIGRVLVFASIADRERVGPTLGIDRISGRAPDGKSCQLVLDGPTTEAWVASENVLVEVLVDPNLTSGEAADRVEAIRRALEPR
jgi:hypothetical protein